MVEVYKCLSIISRPFTWDYFKRKNSPYNLRNTQLLELTKGRTKTNGLNTTLFKGTLLYNKLLNHNLLYLLKIKFGNGQRGQVLVVSALKLSTFKKCTYVKKMFKSVVI